MDGRQTCCGLGVGSRLRRIAALFLLVAGLGWALTPVALAEHPPGRDRSLAVMFGAQGFTDEDLARTYGTVPGLGLRLAVPFDARADFFLGFLHAFDSGDPYYDVPDFSSESAARLRTLPIEFGVRSNTLRDSPHRFHIGIAMQYLWVRERVPGDPLAGREKTTYSGWGWGARVLAGPEWRLSGGRTAVGAEFSWALNSVYVESATDQRKIDLSGLRARGYISVYL